MQVLMVIIKICILEILHNTEKECKSFFRLRASLNCLKILGAEYQWLQYLLITTETRNLGLIALLAQKHGEK